MQRAHLGQVTIGEKTIAPFDEDVCTVNPYLGSDGVMPFVKECAAWKKGIFVLVKTSNPSSGEFQDRVVTDDNGQSCPLYELVGRKVDEWASDPALIGGSGYSEVGAVVGATYPEMGAKLRKIMPKSYILVPGYGAQGGKGKDLTAFFNQGWPWRDREFVPRDHRGLQERALCGSFRQRGLCGGGP